VKVKAPKKKAGGGGAISSTARSLRRETGLWRGGKTLLKMNQQGGFDCPGCAWPEPSPDHRPRLEFCENGAKALAEEATRARATPELLDRSIDELRRLSDYELGHLGRLTQPMVKRADDDRYRAIEWDDALALIGDTLRRLDSPDQAVFYTSGRTSNEAAFLYQLFGRLYGTNNFPDCSNMCHESSGVGLSQVIGVGKGTVSLEDFDHADAIFVIGQNPGTNHPRMLTTLREAARRGCTIVSINPLREPGLVKFSHPQKVRDLVGGGTALAREFLQVRVGGDLALLQAMVKEVLEAEEARPGEILDHAFIREQTTGFDELAAAIGATDWGLLLDESGISRDAIRRAAEIYIGADRVIVCWAMGITQHKHSVATIQEVANLLLLRGNMGRQGAGACPVRGHSNVQGDRTVGIDHRPKDAFLDALGAAVGFEPPRQHGVDSVGAIDAMLDGSARVFVSMGGNFYSASPDTDAVGRALESLRLTVHVSTKLNRAHLYPGEASLILPCLGRSERDEQAGGPQFVTVEDSMSMVHASQGALPPASPHLRSEPAIVCGIARATLGEGGPIDWEAMAGDYAGVRSLIETVVPGFDGYEVRAQQPGGFQLPNGARDRDFTAVGGRAKFTVHEVPRLALPAGQLRLMTLRSHDQYNTTIYGLDDRYRGVYGGRRVIFVNPEEITALGLEPRQLVDLTSIADDGERVARGFTLLPYDLPRGAAGAYFPEDNVLVPRSSVADGSRTPTSKSIVIRISPAAPTE